MSSNLVIVESPTKAKTIEKYLGKEFEVMSSFGHIVDLPKKEMGIDISNNFKPVYEVSSDKKEIVKKLKEHAKKSDMVWLASDEDREGEAIAWHLFNELNLKKEKTKRIVFHEITKPAIKKAIENPRFINENLVSAQQARRVLDRIVGFEISPILWIKIKAGLSAGRVQSVALRLVTEREKEIKKFISTSFYKVTALFLSSQKEKLFTQFEYNFENQQNVLKFLEQFKNQLFIVKYIDKKPVKRSPSAPFTTSTLQQEASLKLGMNVNRTMKTAQQLYEQGFITYMRTDSVNLSYEALCDAEKIIKNKFGSEYYHFRKYKNKSVGLQEAHEAIRPTNFSVYKILGDSTQVKLYEMIWKRTLASQMTDSKLVKTTIEILSKKNKQKFIAHGESILFDGFLKLYYCNLKEDNKQKKINELLPKVEIGEELENLYIQATERFFKPLPRYTESSLVKKLEELGIGRPSTYAPIISTIQQREYVVKGIYQGKLRKYNQITLKNNKIEEESLKEFYGSDKNKLIPTNIGIIVSDFLTENFGKILEYNFTAKVEEQFDRIAEGHEQWTNMLNNFYESFHTNVENVKKNAERATGYRVLGKDPKTKKNVHVKVGKYGAFVQIGETNDDEKPKFAGLLKIQNILTITLEEALKLFELPRKLGTYDNEDLEINNGRYGPYIKYKNLFYSLSKEISPTEITLEEAVQIINEKSKIDVSIHIYENHEITKGKGRFGPFIKWNGIFINVPKKYNFNNLSIQDIESLIEQKKQKDIEKIIRNWEKEGIKLEKGRWGTSIIITRKTKIHLPKTIKADELTLKEVKKIIRNHSKN